MDFYVINIHQNKISFSGRAAFTADQLSRPISFHATPLGFGFGCFFSPRFLILGANPGVPWRPKADQYIGKSIHIKNQFDNYGSFQVYFRSLKGEVFNSELSNFRFFKIGPKSSRKYFQTIPKLSPNHPQSVPKFECFR